ncbi:MAG: hypothetical protein WBV94_06975 [Blastocatellia bacterium]
MTDWLKMFQGVQTIARSAKTIAEGLNLTVTFARNDVNEYDDPEYWSRVERCSSQFPSNAVVSWAREGLEKLDPAEGWGFLILELGDCPDTFRLYKLECESLFAEDKLRSLILSASAVEFGDFAGCFDAAEADAENELYSCEQYELTDHSIEELENDILPWAGGSYDYKGDNGYLLWLVLGSLALIEPLRDLKYCNEILRGRDRLYLLSGFEEIFLYLATVTPEGLSFELANDD